MFTSTLWLGYRGKEWCRFISSNFPLKNNENSVTFSMSAYTILYLTIITWLALAQHSLAPFELELLHFSSPVKSASVEVKRIKSSIIEETFRFFLLVPDMAHVARSHCSSTRALQEGSGNGEPV